MADQKTVDVHTTSGEMAVLDFGGADAGPVVLVFQDAPGIRGSLTEWCSTLAADGYRVVLPDLYHRHGRMLGWETEDAQKDPTVRPRIMELLASVRDDEVQSDAADALAGLGIDRTSAKGTVGFCMGARHVFRTLMAHPSEFVAGAMWHPSFLADDQPDSPHLTAGDLAAGLYMGIGEDDQIQSIAMHQPFLDALPKRADIEVATFPGTDHGYTWPSSPNYNEAAATHSWAATRALFSSAL